MKTISFVTLGCRLNQAEEESLRRQFAEAGILICAPNNADICIVNTCSVTALADKKSRQKIRSLKTENPKLKIVVIGCGASDEIKEADLVIPNKDKRKTFDLVSAVIARNKVTRQIRSPQPKVFAMTGSGRTRALLKIQDGCNNFCAYCIVPYLRGREASVPANDAVAEAKKLDKMGYRELVLSGVNVGKYSSDGNDLTGIIRQILSKTSFKRIRLSSVNPQDITDDMIELWKSEPRLCRHFHLSLQSGSDSVLERMGRPYTAERYLELVQKIKKSMPDLALTTDIIVGFPGETEKEFAETCDFVKQVGFAKLHVFRYSKRVGTRAAEMSDQVPAEVKKARSESLIKIGEVLRNDFVGKCMDKEVEVLFEEKKGEYWYGLSSNYIRVKFKSEENLGNKFRVILSKTNSLL